MTLGSLSSHFLSYDYVGCVSLEEIRIGHTSILINIVSGESHLSTVMNTTVSDIASNLCFFTNLILIIVLHSSSKSCNFRSYICIHIFQCFASCSGYHYIGLYVIELFHIFNDKIVIRYVWYFWNHIIVMHTICSPSNMISTLLM